jgi:hypothetical protein
VTITDLGYGPDPEELLTDEPPDEDDDYEEIVEDLDPEMAGFLDDLIKRIILFCEELAGFEMYPYQRSMLYRIVESLIISDAEEITGLLARQSGKSEVVAVTMAGCMVLLPKLAKTFPILEVQARACRGIFACGRATDLVFFRIISA